MSEAKGGDPLTLERRKNAPKPGRILVMAEETKVKIGNANRGRKLPPLTDEHKKKIVVANTGSKRSEETKRKMRESRAKITVGNKPIWCLETGEFYHSTHEADRKLGWLRGRAKMVVDKPNRTAGGLHFVSHVG